MTRLPTDLRLPRAWDTASAALTVCARALGDARDVPTVAAASGLAFRLSLDGELGLGGPHAYPWREELCSAAERLGYDCEVVSSSEPADSALGRAARTRALALIDRGLASGRPTMVWGVHAPEFGLVRGKGGDRLEVSGILDTIAPAELAVSDLGRGDVPVLFALQLTARIALSAEEAALTALRAALTLGRGAAPTLAGVATGASAFAALSSALDRGVFDPAGLAYAAQRYAEARAAAAGWLDAIAPGLGPLGSDLAAARAGFRRSANMLGELARCHPFPPPPETLIATTGREEARALVDDAARAEAAALDGIEAALAAHARRRLERLRVVDLDRARLPSLFGCIRELPVGLAAEADACREKIAPALGARFFGKLLYEDDRLVGHLLYAPLADAHYPIVAAGARWFIFCPWLAHELRGRGAGALLFDALVADARAAHIDGLLTIGTSDERFLYPAGFARHGFSPVDQRGELCLLERALTDVESGAHLIAPATLEPGGKLPVVVRHSYNCPLLLHSRNNAAAAARGLADQVLLDERDAGEGEGAGAAVAGRPLIHGFVPLAALTTVLRDEADRWQK
ncbi:MAG TPA: GNAT family N-acetyltransferase [Polyangia bacterium]